METEMSVVSVIGDLNWEKHTGLEARIIETLKEMPVCMISYGSSTHNLSVLVREQDREKGINDTVQKPFWIFHQKNLM
mgnify:CR=1 FL=1